MATNMRNSTVANFYRRFKRYLKLRYSLDGKQAYEALQSIRAAEYEGDDPLVKRYRDLLPPKPEKGRLEEAIFVVHSTTKVGLWVSPTNLGARLCLAAQP